MIRFILIWSPLFDHNKYSYNRFQTEGKLSVLYKTFSVCHWTGYFKDFFSFNDGVKYSHSISTKYVGLFVLKNVYIRFKVCKHVQNLYNTPFFHKEKITKPYAVTTDLTCMVIVHVLWIFPVVAPVAARSVKNRIEAIAGAT